MPEYNAVSYGEEPTEVFASLYSTPKDPRFQEVEENVIWQMRFPSGVLANNATGYGSHESRRYRVYAETAWFGMDPAFSYEGLRMELSRAEGMVEHHEQPQTSSKNQFALEMDHFAECVKSGKRPYTPGEEGLQESSDHGGTIPICPIRQTRETDSYVKTGPNARRSPSGILNY